MMKKLILVTVGSLALMTGLALAAPPNQQYFHVDAAGELDGDKNSKAQHIKRTTNQIWFQPDQEADDLVWFTLSGIWDDKKYDNGKRGSVCFKDKLYKGSLRLFESTDGLASATFWFTAKNDPVSGVAQDVKYVLTLTDPDSSGWAGTFIPTDGKPALMNATHWKMGTEGKGKLTKEACKGEANDVSVPMDVWKLER
jgi:hypothetical protein